MADLSKIKLNGTTYNFKDTKARSSLENVMIKGTDYVTAGQKSGTTLGVYATAEGFRTTASGSSSHAEGGSSTASGDWSHAEGNSAEALGQASHAEGTWTIAQRKSQHVFGEYNILDATGSSTVVRGSYIEIVGNGTADNARSNARTLDWSGNETLAGKLTLGAAPTNNMDAATKQYVDNAIPTVPTNVSSFTNDSGYITSYTETDPVFSASAAAGIQASDITNWNSKSAVQIVRW